MHSCPSVTFYFAASWLVAQTGAVDWKYSALHLNDDSNSYNWSTEEPSQELRCRGRQSNYSVTK